MSENNPNTRQGLSTQEKHQISAALRFLGLILVCVIVAATIAGVIASLLQNVG